MALRSLARGMWGPAVRPLRCRSGAGTPAAACSRFLNTSSNQIKQHSYEIQKEAADEHAILMKELDKVLEQVELDKVLEQVELDKVLENLRQLHTEGVAKLHSEVKGVAKIYLATVVGMFSYAEWRYG